METAILFCEFACTTQDKHATIAMHRVGNRNFSPWFESIRDDLSKAKRERRQT